MQWHASCIIRKRITQKCGKTPQSQPPAWLRMHKAEIPGNQPTQCVRKVIMDALGSSTSMNSSLHLFSTTPTCNPLHTDTLAGSWTLRKSCRATPSSEPLPVTWALYSAAATSWTQYRASSCRWGLPAKILHLCSHRSACQEGCTVRGRGYVTLHAMSLADTCRRYNGVDRIINSLLKILKWQKLPTWIARGNF